MTGSSIVAAFRPHAAGDGGEVDRLELAAELGIAEEDHLLPFDLPERVVLDDDDLDIVEAVFA